LAKLKDTPSQQKHATVYLKIFFNWAIAEGYLEINPLQSYKQGKAPRRKRILTDEELRAVWNATFEIEGMFGLIVRLIILTGQRRGEIAALLRTYYSHNQQIITLPGTLTKNHLEHTFPVRPDRVPDHHGSDRIAPRRDSDFLFPARISIERPFNGWSKCRKSSISVPTLDFARCAPDVPYQPWPVESPARHCGAPGQPRFRPDGNGRNLRPLHLPPRNARSDGEVGGIRAGRLHRRPHITRGLIIFAAKQL